MFLAQLELELIVGLFSFENCTYSFFTITRVLFELETSCELA